MVVKEYEAGASVNRLRQNYGIGSPGTIKHWIQQYGRSGYRTELVVIQTVDDQMEVKAMKQRIADLDNRMLNVQQMPEWTTVQRSCPPTPHLNPAKTFVAFSLNPLNNY